jgi:5-carboxymethyl-2-hydroxymuconate isomerase
LFGIDFSSKEPLLPHCIIEHSASLEADSLLPLVYQGALLSQLFEPDGSDIKVRTVAYQHASSGGQPMPFVHVQLKILTGRTLQQKQALSKLVLQQLTQLDLQGCSHTVEVIDIDRASYSKWVS